MPTLRQRREELEKLMICDYGVLSSQSAGRLKGDDDEDELRTCFQRDVDRITHCKSFRRLKHKTQVFLQPEGDHYRTRLTHTLEVARIARTIARALMLNEDLTEAIALGHDIGHTPFGHAGERALNELFEPGFKHYEQSLRVVDRIEKGGEGLNLCMETRKGILSHTFGSPDDTCEATCVRMADRIAYINHDIDDAIRAGIINPAEIPPIVRKRVGDRYSTRINTLVLDVIEHSAEGEIKMSPDMSDAFEEFHEYMFDAVYRNPKAKGEESKVKNLLGGIWDFYVEHPEMLPKEYMLIAYTDGVERAVCDYISGMTDDFAVQQYSDIYIPEAWHVK